MANLGVNFDATTVQPASFELLPKGEYLARIVESDVVENSSKTGTLLKLTLEVVEGQFTGRKLFDQLNLTNPNELAVRISRERLSAYCHATGVMQVTDTAQLHGIPFLASVKIRVDTNGVYDDANEIRSVKKCQAGATGGAPQSFAQQTPPPQNGFGAANAVGGAAQAGFNQQPAFGLSNTHQGQGQGQGFAQGGFIQQPNNAQPQPVTQQGNPQGAAGFYGQPQGQVTQPAGQGNGWNIANEQNQVVDTSAVPPMNFGQGMQSAQEQVVQQPVQQQAVQQQAPVNHGVDNQQANPNKAPWEQ